MNASVVVVDMDLLDLEDLLLHSDTVCFTTTTLRLAASVFQCAHLIIESSVCCYLLVMQVTKLPVRYSFLLSHFICSLVNVESSVKKVVL